LKNHGHDKQESTGFVFEVFKKMQRSLRGTGLGRSRLLRKLRDAVYNTVRPRKEMHITVLGMKMIVDPNQSGIVPDLLRDGIFERCETALIDSSLKKGSVFVDVGSNIGYYTLLSARKVEAAGHVFAFEPEPENFHHLKRNVELNRFTNVTLVQKALSDRSTSQHLVLNKDNTGGHHLGGAKSDDTSVVVETLTLDAFWGDRIPRVDVIKMDIEGHEPLAFAGMQATVKANPSVQIITEYYPSMIEKAGASAARYLDQLYELGFRIQLIDEVTNHVSLASRESILRYCARNEYANLLCIR